MGTLSAVPFLGRALPALGRLFDPPVAEVGGASTTPNVFVAGPSGNIEAASMRFVADLSLDDVARIMHRRVGAVKAMQARALAQLAARLDRDA